MIKKTLTSYYKTKKIIIINNTHTADTTLHEAYDEDKYIYDMYNTQGIHRKVPLLYDFR